MLDRARVRFLSIDAGTTSLKVAVCDLEGRLVAIEHEEYTLETPAPAFVELDPEVYWRACCRAVHSALQRSATEPGQVAALAISSQGETLIPVDEHGAPTRKAIVWLDNRAVQEAEATSRAFGRDRIYAVTGQPDATPTWPACKLLWLREHEPEVFRRSARFLLLEDYLLYQLTGQYATEFALQSSSLMLDIQRHAWWPEMLQYLGLDADRLATLLAPAQVVGPVSETAARALGLTTNTLAVTGAIDVVVSAVGAGNLAPGVVTESTGGALAILATIDKPQYDPLHRVPCHTHVTRDRYCLLPWGQTGGMALRWLRDQFFAFETQVALNSNLDPYDLMTAMAARVPPGCDGMVALPHLEGAACPEFNPAARGVFYGATLRHTRAHFVRAILESVAFMLRKNLDIVRELGVSIREVRSTGGGARSGLWLQIKADVLQLPVMPVAIEEVACVGAAAMAATATGYYRDLAEASARMVSLGKRIAPRADLQTTYDLAYRRYLQLYDRLDMMFGT